MKTAKIRRRIDDALARGRIARIERWEFDNDTDDGVVIATSTDWIAVHTLAFGVHLDEVVMLRRADITAVRFIDDNAYHHRAIAGLGEPLAEVELGDDIDVRALLQIASARGTLVAVHFEQTDDLSIGRIVELRDRSFDLDFVGRDGVWAPERERWKYRDVTRIEFGGRYLGALERFADPYEPATAGSATAKTAAG